MQVHLCIGYRDFIHMVPVQQPLPQRSEVLKLRRTEGRHKLSAANPDYRFLASEMMSNDLLCLLVVIPTFSRKPAEIFGSCYTLQFQRFTAFCRLLWDRAVHWPFSLWEDAPRPPASHNKSKHAWLTESKQLGQIKPEQQAPPTFDLPARNTFLLPHFKGSQSR